MIFKSTFLLSALMSLYDYTRCSIEISSASFDKVIASDAFVDKTLLIKHLFETELAVFVKAPRKFGKTTIINMLKNFFELEVDTDGIKSSEEASKNSKIFKNRLSNNEYLKIFNERQFFVDNYGQFPVIILDFTSIKGRTNAQLIYTIRRLISDMYVKYRYVLPSLPEIDQAQFQSLLDLSTNNVTSFVQSGVKLTEYLHKYFKKQCIVLIDELDAPLNQIIHAKMTAEEIEQMITFLRKFITLLVSNWSVKWVYMTGQTNLANVFLTEAKNVNILYFTDNEAVGRFFGFTKGEVSVLLKNLNQNGKLTTKEIEDWYEGYSVIGSQITIFNPFSILMYLHSGKPGLYWTKLDSLEHFSSMFYDERAGEEISDSLQKNIVIGNDIIDAGLGEISSLKEIIYDPENGDVSLFLQYLHELGYYTLANVSDPHLYLLDVRIPNKEIKINLVSMYYETMRNRYDLSGSLLEDLSKSVVNLDADGGSYIKLANTMSALLQRSKKLPKNEAELNSIIFASVLFWDDSVIVDRVIKTLYGKVGLLILRKRKGNSTASTGIIVRVKYGRESSSYAALLQLRGGDHEEIFESRAKKEGLLIGTKIYVGLGCKKSFDCTVSYLYNSLSLTDVKNITAK